MPLDQSSRRVKIKLPIDNVVLTGFRGNEEISRLFRYELDLISDKNDISASDIVGKNVTFSTERQDGSPRYFNGFVNRFFAGDEDDKHRRNYRAEVVPWIWFLTLNTDCRIFQNKSVPEIIEQVFQDNGFTDYSITGVKADHLKRDYCVQYRESDFDFINRLCEEEGIFWFFQHEENKHQLILADSHHAYVNCAESKVDFPRDVGSRAMKDHITAWEHRYEFRTGKWSQTDYNFETPSQDLTTNEPTFGGINGMEKFEKYDYPGEYQEKADGDRIARLRIEEEEVHNDVVAAESYCSSFSPGGKFEIQEHRSSSEEKKKYVITCIQHEAQEPLAYESGSPDAGFDYRNEFSCIPDDKTFRPARETRRPFVQGPQTAVVVGPSGEEIYPDKYGRVKVQFHWDRQGKKDEESSCWLRVSQNWAGKGWGGMFIPHVGQEVIVDFLEGDPDRPIVTGRVYNAEQTVPLELPINKTASMICDDGGNDFVMEGKDGEQYIHLRQKCGNGLLMDGQNGKESIQLRDKFGNTVYLGAHTKTISLYAPNHNSGFVLGRSKHQFCKSNSFDFAGGWSVGAYVGAKNNVFGGLKFSATLGMQTDLFLGAKCSGAYAHTLEYTKGKKISFGGDTSYAKTSNDYYVEARKNVVIDAGDTIWLLGGKGDNGALRADKKNLQLTFSAEDDSRSDVIDPQLPMLKALAPQSLNLLMGAAQAVAQFRAKSEPIGGRKDKEGKVISSTQEDKTQSLMDTFGSVAMGGAIAGITAIDVAKIARTMALEQDNRRNAIKDHNSPTASVKLDRSGVTITSKFGDNEIKTNAQTKEARVYSKGTVNIEGNKVIALKSTNGSIVLNARNGANFKDCPIKHANFSVEK